YRQGDGSAFRYFPLSLMRVSSAVSGNVSLTLRERSEAGANGKVQTLPGMRCLSDVASFRLLHLKYASPLSSMLRFNFGRPTIGGGHCKPPSFNLLRAAVYHPPIRFQREESPPRLWLMAEVLKLRQLSSRARSGAYVGNNLNRAINPTEECIDAYVWTIISIKGTKTPGHLLAEFILPRVEQRDTPHGNLPGPENHLRAPARNSPYLRETIWTGLPANPKNDGTGGCGEVRRGTRFAAVN
ncbi:hypothetical protein X777_17000, partial [Ooceraea biroi]